MINYRRVRANRTVQAALSDEIKEQIKQRVYELIEQKNAEPQLGDSTTVPSLTAPAQEGQETPPPQEAAAPEVEGGDNFGFGDFESFGEDAGATAEEPAQAADAGTTEPQVSAPADGVALPQGGESMDNAAVSEQDNISPTMEQNFDDDGSESFFDIGDSLDYSDVSDDGDFEDATADEMPALIPPKSRQESEPAPEPAASPSAPATESAPAQAPAAEAAPAPESAPEPKVSPEPAPSSSMPEVKNPSKNTKVPTLDKEADTAFGRTLLMRRGRYDRVSKLLKFGSTGNYVNRKNKDSMPDGDTGSKPSRDPEIRAPKKEIRDTVRESKKSDPDIGHDPDARKD